MCARSCGEISLTPSGTLASLRTMSALADPTTTRWGLVSDAIATTETERLRPREERKRREGEGRTGKQEKGPIP